MGNEKTGTKGGLFHLFDWNKKSRKKLFANGNGSSDGTKQGAKVNDNVEATRPCVMEDDDTRGLLSVKGSSDYSCASSVTDEEGNGTRAPGVVARLMGLDSLPTVCVSEPYSTPLFDSQSLREHVYRKRGADFHIDDLNPNIKSDCYVRKPLDLRSQRMPSSPIERFQTEVLPPRSVKSFPINHYKLLSPIKNSSFVSGTNATHIMEAAAKILEPGLCTSAKGRSPPLCSSSVLLKVRDPKDSIAISQRLSRLPESPRSLAQPTATKYLKASSSYRSWNAPEDSIRVRVFPEWEEASSTGARSKMKTVSLAIQAKVNVQKREGSTSSDKILAVHRDQDEAKVNQIFKSQENCKNKLQKNASRAGASDVLKQNNQKQNCQINRDKTTPRSSMPNQQAKKIPLDASSRKNRFMSNSQGAAGVGYRKEDLHASDNVKDASSSRAKNVPRKKRLIHRNYQSDSDTIVVANHDKHIQTSVMIDEHQKWDEECKRNGSDIVSFTFTSPMIKSSNASRSTLITKKNDSSSFSVVMEGERNNSDAIAGTDKVSARSLNMINGDALSLLLEQKLRELTSGLQSTSSSIAKVEDSSASDFCSGIAPEIDGSDQNESPQGSCRASPCTMLDDLSSVNNGLYLRRKLHDGAESAVGCGHGDTHNELEQCYPSPLSIIEASFSSESCSSSDTFECNSGSKTCSSTDAHDCLERKDPPEEAEMDISDSASSIFAGFANVEHASGTRTDPDVFPRNGRGYVKDIIQHAGVNLDKFGCQNYSLDPMLFDLLENKRNSLSDKPEDKNLRLWRKVLFDCVGECLESNCSRYMKAGSKSWAKNVAIICREDDFVDKIYKEIMCWKSMGDWMVDDLVDKDMSTHFGRWLNFEVEAFEAGMEIQEVLVCSLIDEVVSDFMM